jgi:predicted nucleotidyltransferase component of viral defense system
MDFAERLGLEARVIEKDYVLGWMLAGIRNHAALKDGWVFKGGTCLKKCYFETYRFSEDLDFTLRDSAHINMEFLSRVFAEVATWVADQSGIEVPLDAISFNIHPDPAKKYVEGRVGYAGPLGRNRGNVAKIKLDISANEILVKEPVSREVYHPYSDRPGEGIHALSYDYEEVFAEKVRALAERLRPRDLYDVVHLYRRRELVGDRGVVLTTLDRSSSAGSPAVKRLQHPSLTSPVRLGRSSGFLLGQRSSRRFPAPSNESEWRPPTACVSSSRIVVN